MDLRDVDANAILEMLAKGDVDHQNCWLGRAYATFDGGSVPQAFRDTLTTEIATVIAVLDEYPTDGKFVLYRGLLSKPDLTSIGRHWSDSRAVACDHGPYLITAIVRADDVDWCGTVLRRIGWPRERELTLKPEAYILVETIEHRERIVTHNVAVAVSSPCPTLSLRNDPDKDFAMDDRASLCIAVEGITSDESENAVPSSHLASRPFQAV